MVRKKPGKVKAIEQNMGLKVESYKKRYRGKK